MARARLRRPVACSPALRSAVEGQRITEVTEQLALEDNEEEDGEDGEGGGGGDSGGEAGEAAQGVPHGVVRFEEGY